MRARPFWCAALVTLLAAGDLVIPDEAWRKARDRATRPRSWPSWRALSTRSRSWIRSPGAVIPVGSADQELRVLTRRRDGTFEEHSVFPVRFVPMTGKAQKE